MGRAGAGEEREQGEAEREVAGGHLDRELPSLDCLPVS